MRTHEDPPLRLVTQIINSLLGLVIFTLEKEFLRATLKERVAGRVGQGWPAWTFDLGSAEDSLGDLAYHLRNGASHGRVTFSSDSTDPRQVVVTFEDAKTRTSPVY